MQYETLKHTGEYPIIGVNTLLSSKDSPTIIPQEVIRATTDEKEYQIKMLRSPQNFQQTNTAQALENIQEAAVQNKNIFIELMEVCKVCSFGQITKALFEVDEQYRRSM